MQGKPKYSINILTNRKYVETERQQSAISGASFHSNYVPPESYPDNLKEVH